MTFDAGDNCPLNVTPAEFTPADTVESTALVERVRGWGISVLRTAVPGAWGYVLAWLASQIPVLEPVLERPEVVGASGAITFGLGLGWYAVMRWVEPRLPAWLTRVVLGANARPLYVDGHHLDAIGTPSRVRGDLRGR
jgi:hypothetical protein